MDLLSIGLSLVISSFIIFILLFFLHCSQHFHYQCCIRVRNNFIKHKDLSKRNSIRVSANNIIRKLKHKETPCRCCLVAIDDSFDFFPVAFLLYVIYLMILLILIICKYTLYTNKNSNAIDYLLIYFVIILSIIESLFNFYRFYSTYHASKNIILLTTSHITCKFMLFALPFLLLCIAQIHLFYYLYPLIILIYFTFNTITVWLFGHILIVQYRFSMGSEEYLNDIHDEMLSSVYLMRRVSLCASISSSIYISLFIIITNINIILYLPILWLISCCGLTLNFVRNRQYLHQLLLKCIKYRNQLQKDNNLIVQTNNNNVRTRALSVDKLISALESKKKQNHILANDSNFSLPTTTLPKIKDSVVMDPDVVVVMDVDVDGSNNSTPISSHNNNNESGIKINAPSIIIKETPTNSHTASTPKSSSNKWFNLKSIKNKISTPISYRHNENISIDITLSPMGNNTDTYNTPIYNGDPTTILSPNTIKRRKAMKLLGITAIGNDTSGGSSSVKYLPPTTPMPIFFNHLRNAQRFPSLPPQEMYNEDDENEYEDDIDDDDDQNDNNMMYLQDNIETSQSDIAVSKNRPGLTIKRISVQLDTPQIIQEALKNRASATATQLQIEEKIAINSDDDNVNDYSLDLDDDFQTPIPTTNDFKFNVEMINDKLPKTTPNILGMKHTTSQSVANVANTKSIISKSNKAYVQRVRSQSHANNDNNNNNKKKHINRAKNKPPTTPLPDVVGVFKVLASHGLYSTKNVLSAQQLRDYTKKM